jgi:site-specific recombinase XerD
MGSPAQRGEIMNEFEASMRRRGLAESSIAKRAAIVRRWWDYAGDPFTRRITWRHVDRFVDASSMNSPASRYAAVSHLHRFYVWAQREGHARHDPTVLVERARMPHRLPRPAHDTDLAIALTLATGPIRAAILVASTSGLRCLELARLRWIDVAQSSIRVTGKGNRDRVLPLHPLAVAALDDLDRVDDYVFPWREARDISPGRRVSHTLNKYFRSIGCATTAHQLRHWCATNALAATGDLRAVQDLLGHASPATTAIYAALDPTRLREVVDAIRVPGIATPTGAVTHEAPGQLTLI